MAGLPVTIALTIGIAVLVAPGVAAQEPLRIGVGVGDGTVAGQSYLPGSFSVLAGDTVSFVITSDEPHTITFGFGPAEVPPPFWPVAGWEAFAPEGPPPYDLGEATFTGMNHLNTGILIGKGTSASVVFPTPGKFPFYCAIHPGMAGEVEVLESGEATSQAEADAAGQLTSELLLNQVDRLRADRLAAARSTTNADGTVTWTVFTEAGLTTADPMPGGGTGYLELLEFTPAEMEISVGDSVRWVAESVHTVTFIPEGADPVSIFPSEEAAFAPVGGLTYDGSEPASSGILGFPLDPSAPPATEYSLTFPREGVFPYFCVLHRELGQVGTVKVSPAS